jgi:hypothetical protein
MRSVTALLTGVAAAVSASVFLGWWNAGLTTGSATASLVLGALVAVLAWRACPALPGRKAQTWDYVMGAVFALASLRAFLWLIYPSDDEWRVLSPNNLGDMSLHLQFIRYLASGVPFWPESPILGGVPLTYPLGADLFNSLLLLAGVPVERGLVWTGLAGAALAGWALWRWGGAFGLAALLFNGGLAGFAIFQSGITADFQADLAWKNLFLSVFVTQRGFLYALPAGLALLWTWRYSVPGERPLLPFWVQLVLYAAIPLFSVHSFLFLSLVAAVVFLCSSAARRPLFLLVAASFVPATIAMALVTGGFSAKGGLRFLPGWMQGDGGPVFWAMNFGIALPLVVWLAVRVRKNPADVPFVAAGLLTFALAFLFAFAPWEWDNIKLLIWAWLVCAPSLWSLVIAPEKPLVRAILCGALFFSGAVSLVGGLDGRHGYKLASRSELAATAAVLEPVRPGERIATEPDFNNPVILLGHPVFCGYEGHLWSHGLDYKERFAKLRRLLDAGAERASASTIDADWLFFRGTPPLLVPLRRAPSPDTPVRPGF